MDRRDFLRISASAATVAGIAPWMRADASTSKLRAWVTSDSRRFQQAPCAQWNTEADIRDNAIHLLPEQRYQDILGFGAAFTDASCWLIMQMPAPQRTALLQELFGPSGLRFSLGRTCIGSSDYSLSAYTFDDAGSPNAPDTAMDHFTIEHDRGWILPCLREARALDPNLFLFSSPWSPPAWMKSNNSIYGGSMRNRYFEAYAKYFVNFLEQYAAAGVPINAVTVQNEVDTDQDGRMPAALWGQEYEITFVKTHLGPALAKASPQTKIWILDHNYNLWGRALDELSDPAVEQYVDGVAWHGYYGGADAMTHVHDSFPGKNAYWTEGGPDYTDPLYTKDWTKWSSTFTNVLRNWSRCICGWNLALDEKGKPDIGPFSCGGLVTIDSASHQITRSGQYWAFAHFSKLMGRGARIFASKGDIAGVSHVAAENPDGSQVLILTNEAHEQSVQCVLESRSINVTLPADSVTSLSW
ncbi:MAG TPA: glycoside hydrolase family 30 protein [Acidobacteriaceae bacterium]